MFFSAPAAVSCISEKVVGQKLILRDCCLGLRHRRLERRVRIPVRTQQFHRVLVALDLRLDTLVG